MAANGPATGGSTITLRGNNFGPTGSSLSMSIGAAPCTTTSYVSTTSVVCTQPAGTGAANAVKVFSGSQIGTLLRSFTFDGAFGLLRFRS